ncbi:PH domain-containing protein [Kineococcus endophyticus]|uniref:PH domain-containing protein n=1 Tax=Kineococcus endophyticus TaxID=1181883 RepID=A0ABV3PC72_9ACTN
MPFQVAFDKQEQLDKIQQGLLPGEEVYAVFDAIGAGTGFIGVTSLRVIVQDNSFVGKKVALTSVPYGKVTAVSYVSDKSMFGKFASSSSIAITAGGRVYEVDFRGDDKARYVHDLVLRRMLGI